MSTHESQFMDRPGVIAKSAFSFLSGTMVSRITGVIRDMSMACFFGANASIAAFFVALRFAILLRRIFGEGALLNGFVPYFEHKRKEDPKKAAAFFRDVFFSVALVLLVFILVAEAVLYFWLPNQIVFLVMLILPGVPFICLFGICSGLLHCEKYFFLTGVAPVAYNLIWIASVWLFRNELPQTAAVFLSLSISVAFFFQWLITFPKSLSYFLQLCSWKDFFSFRLFSPEMRAMFTSLSLGVLGVTAAQISTAIDPLFSRVACLEGPAYLNYAIHLQQLPLALFGVGVSSALLPPLSRAFASGDGEQSRTLLEFAISNTMLLVLPCTLAIFSLGSVSVNLLYGRGDFSQLATLQTTYCLWGYGLGLVPMVITLLLAPAYYAKKDYWTPTKASLISIGVGLLSNTFLIFFLRRGPATIAFSTSLTAFLNAYLLYLKLDVRLSSALFTSVFKSLVCSVLAAIVTFYVGLKLNIPILSDFSRNFSEQMIQFLSLFGTFSIVFIASALLLKREEIFTLVRKVKSIV